MAKKNQMTQPNDSSNSIVELTDEDLQQVVGGVEFTLVSKPPVLSPVFIEADTDPNGNQPWFQLQAYPIFVETNPGPF